MSGSRNISGTRLSRREGGADRARAVSRRDELRSCVRGAPGRRRIRLTNGPGPRIRGPARSPTAPSRRTPRSAAGRHVGCRTGAPRSGAAGPLRPGSTGCHRPRSGRRTAGRPACRPDPAGRRTACRDRRPDRRDRLTRRQRVDERRADACPRLRAEGQPDRHGVGLRSGAGSRRRSGTGRRSRSPRPAWPCRPAGCPPGGRPTDHQHRLAGLGAGHVHGRLGAQGPATGQQATAVGQCVRRVR